MSMLKDPFDLHAWIKHMDVKPSEIAAAPELCGNNFIAVFNVVRLAAHYQHRIDDLEAELARERSYSQMYEKKFHTVAGECADLASAGIGTVGEVFGMPIVVDTRLPPGTWRTCPACYGEGTCTTINSDERMAVTDTCGRCGGSGTLRPGRALQQTYTGIPDFPGDQNPATVSPGGPGKLVDCLKCTKCGHSVTP